MSRNSSLKKNDVSKNTTILKGNIFKEDYKNQDNQVSFRLIIKENEYNMSFNNCLWNKNQKGILITFHNQSLLKQSMQIQSLKEVNQFKDHILRTVTHDLRTPLISIKQMVQAIIGSDNIQDSINREYLTKMENNCEMLELLICDILDYSQIQSQKQLKLRPEEFDMYNLLNELKDIYDFPCQKKGIQIKFSNKSLGTLQPDQFKIISDRLRVKQILMNLIGNAIKFTQKGQVEIIISFSDFKNQNESQIKQCLYVQVKDTGIGIAKSRQDQLFKIFSTFNDERQNNQNGIGLGLTISQDLVALLGPQDKIKLESKINQGSTFSFFLYQNIKEGNFPVTNEDNSYISEFHQSNKNNESINVQKMMASYDTGNNNYNFSSQSPKLKSLKEISPTVHFSQSLNPKSYINKLQHVQQSVNDSTQFPQFQQKNNQKSIFQNQNQKLSIVQSQYQSILNNKNNSIFLKNCQINNNNINKEVNNENTINIEKSLTPTDFNQNKKQFDFNTRPKQKSQHIQNDCESNFNLSIPEVSAFEEEIHTSNIQSFRESSKLIYPPSRNFFNQVNNYTNNNLDTTFNMVSQNQTSAQSAPLNSITSRSYFQQSQQNNVKNMQTTEYQSTCVSKNNNNNSNVNIKINSVQSIKNNLNILIVDDNAFNVESLKSLLKINFKQFYNITVNEAYDGQQAIDAILEEDNFNFIFMDINMPILDGISASKQIRKLEKEKKIKKQKIWVCSANGEDYKNHKKKGIIDDIIPKPVQVQFLKTKISKLIPLKE